MWQSNIVMDPDLELVRLVGSTIIFQEPNPTFSARVSTLQFRHLKKNKSRTGTLFGFFRVYVLYLTLLYLLPLGFHCFVGCWD
jgi:hypothetical protein